MRGAVWACPRPWPSFPRPSWPSGPGLRHLTAAYGTPLFALLAAVAWWAATAAARSPERRPLEGRAPPSPWPASLLGLARPEGVFLGGFFLVAVIVYRRGEGARALVSRFLLVFLTLGLAYFLWRWHYFGHPLPNPFYRKGGGVLHPHSLRMAWRNLWDLVAALPGRRRRALRRARRDALAVFALLPVARLRRPLGPHLRRDQLRHALPLPHPARGAGRVRGCRGPVARPERSRPPAPAAWALAAGPLALLVAGGLAAYQHSRYRHIAPQRMGLYDAALVLRDYSRRNYALATTEAGLLPLYSTWRAVDAWGLNDAFIAHDGGITEEYLDRYRPEVIVFHAYFSPETRRRADASRSARSGPAWYRMVTTLKRYAEKNGYTLAAVFGRNAWDTHYYYVRPASPTAAPWWTACTPSTTTGTASPRPTSPPPRASLSPSEPPPLVSARAPACYTPLFVRSRPRRLEAQDPALSRPRHGFESRRGRQVYSGMSTSAKLPGVAAATAAAMAGSTV